MHEPAFTVALTKLVSLIEAYDLATPLHIGWSVHPHPHISIQVEARYVRAWAEIMTVTTVDTKNTDNARHMHMWGHLPDGNTRVYLTAVAPLTDQVEPVSS